MREKIEIMAPKRAEHSEGLFALLDTHWQGVSAQCRRGRIWHSHYDWDVSRVALVNGVVAAHWGVYQMHMRIGECAIPCAGINLVVTHPEYRGLGLMRLCVESSMPAFSTEGYDISLICNGIDNFYGKYGYAFAWPEVIYTVAVAELPHNPLPDGWKIHRFALDNAPDLSALGNAENAGLTGTAVRPSYPRGKNPDDEDDGFYWTDETDNMRGYMIGGYDPDSGIHFYEDGAGERLLDFVAWKCRHSSAKTLQCFRLHPQTALAQQLRHLNCMVSQRYSANGGFMMRMINLTSLCQRLQPEFNRRLRHSAYKDWSGVLTLNHEQAAVSLNIVRGEVSVVPATTSLHSLATDHRFAQLLVGTFPPQEFLTMTRPEIKGEAAGLITALFPAQTPQISAVDL